MNSDLVNISKENLSVCLFCVNTHTHTHTHTHTAVVKETSPPRLRGSEYQRHHLAEWHCVRLAG